MEIFPSSSRDQKDVTSARPRASSKYRCGYESVGMACAEGPTDSGVCCQAAARKRCRPQTGQSCDALCAAADSCEILKLREESRRLANDDLGPCIPIRASWFSREVVALNLAILTGGLLLSCMAFPFREQAFVPGGLSAKHSQILGNRLVSERCSVCHPQSHGIFSTLGSQDALCMKCHDGHMPDAVHGNPHDLSAAQLVSLNSVQFGTGKQEAAERTSCAMCHIEHHGAEYDIRAMTDKRCQACHQQSFQSLSDGHPEFENFPYRTQRRIAFDHRSHADKYFAQKNENFKCDTCHVDHDKLGAVGDVFRTVGFEKACGQCHTESMKASMIDGWVLMQLPSVESEDVSERVAGLENWPSSAQFGYDGVVSPMMRWLLSADENLLPALEQLPANRQLADLRVSEINPRRAAQAIAVGVRQLIEDSAARGQRAWIDRLTTYAERRLGRKLSATEEVVVERTVVGLPPDLFRQMDGVWFGNQQSIASKEPLDRGIPKVQLASGQISLDDDDALLLGLDAGASDDELGETKTAKSKPVLTKVRASQHVTSGGWYLDADVLALRYMPTGHADHVLAAWAQYAVLVEGAVESDGAAAQASGSHFDLLKFIPGGCNECHILSAAISDPIGNWKSVAKPSSVKTFTRFDHTPHLTLPSCEDCSHCHVLHKPADTEATLQLKDLWMKLSETTRRPMHTSIESYHSTTRDFLESEFVSMRREQCSACHQPKSANDACTQCHNYHVGTSGLEWQSR